MRLAPFLLLAAMLLFKTRLLSIMSSSKEFNSYKKKHVIFLEYFLMYQLTFFLACSL